MYHVRIITTGVPIVQVSDGQGNVYPRFLNETLLSKVATKTNLTFKRSTTLWGYEFNYEAIYNVAIDVIDSLLEDDVDGVILIYEQETMSEFAFYLSLFTIMYNKPIVLYSLSVNSQKIAISKRSNPGKDEAHMPAFKHALNIVTNDSYQKLGPLTVINHKVFLAIDEHIEIIQRGNNSIQEAHKTFIEKLHLVNQKVGFLPVIPQKVIIIPITLGMQGKEILNIVKHYAGAVLVVTNLRRISPSIKRAIERLINFQIPIMIVEKYKETSNQEGDQINDHYRFYEWTVHQLTSKHARILLGTMIAQKMTRNHMKKICKIFRRH